MDSVGCAVHVAPHLHGSCTAQAELTVEWQRRALAAALCPRLQQLWSYSRVLCGVLGASFGSYSRNRWFVHRSNTLCTCRREYTKAMCCCCWAGAFRGIRVSTHSMTDAQRTYLVGCNQVQQVLAVVAQLRRCAQRFSTTSSATATAPHRIASVSKIRS
jgi:hypothetical protein